MKFKFLSLLAITFTILFSSCNNNENDGPVITLTTPADEQDFEIGDTIFIEGTITDEEALHELMLVLYKQETGDTVVHYMPTVHDMESFSIDTFYVPDDTVHIHFHLNIEAWDHDNNKAQLEYTLHWAD